MRDFGITNYADDSTPSSVNLNYQSVVEELQISSSVLFIWLQNNYMKANTEKSHLWLCSTGKLIANIDGSFIESEDNKILLDITIDSNVLLNKHITTS